MLNMKLKGIAPDLTGEETIAYSPLRFSTEPIARYGYETALPGEPLEIINNNDNGTTTVRFTRDIVRRHLRYVSIPSDYILEVDPDNKDRQTILALSTALGLKIPHKELVEKYYNLSSLLESFLFERDIRVALSSSEYLRLANLRNKELIDIPLDSPAWFRHVSLITDYYHASKILAKAEDVFRRDFLIETIKSS